MNNINRTLHDHWVMTNTLMEEVVGLVGPEGLHGHHLMEELFHQFAARDPRFNAEGFRWNQERGFMQYTSSMDGLNYYGEAAIAAFLGMPVRGKGMQVQAKAASLRFIYRQFEDKYKARDYLRERTLRVCRKLEQPDHDFMEID